MYLKQRMLACLFIFALNMTPLTLRSQERPASDAEPPEDSNPTQIIEPPGDTNSFVITNPQIIAIPDDAYNGTLGSMACSNLITTSMIPSTTVVQSVSISVGLDHTWVGDLTMKLQAPNGSVLTILNRPVSTAPDDGTDNPIGDNSNWAAGTIINFGDGLGPEAETMGNSLSDAQNICINDGICGHDPSPDTATQPPSAFTAFRNTQASGVWRLCVGDSAALDTGNLRTWSLNLNFAAVFSQNPVPNSVPDDGYVGGFGGVGQLCSTMTIPTLSGGNTVQGVFVGVTMSHTWVGDLTMKLRSPSGTIFTFLNRPGSTALDDGGGAVGNNANWSNVQLLFGDGFGPESETMGTGLTTDQRVCIDNGVCSHDPSPDTATSPASFAAAFNGQGVAGNWTLCVGDSALGDVGTVNNWRLNFVNSLAPTAAPVSVSGRVSTSLGSSIRNARVVLTSASGQSKQTMTNSFGNFSFEGVDSGETYLLSVQAKGYTFETRSIRVEDSISDLEIIGQPSLFFKQR